VGIHDGVEAIAHDRGVSGFDASRPADLVSLARDLIGRRDELSEFLSLREQRAVLATRGLGPFISRAEETRLQPSVIHSLFTGLVSQRRAEQIRRTDLVLSRAAGVRIEAARNAFVERDRRKIEHDRQMARTALLSARPPAGDRYGSRIQWTE